MTIFWGVLPSENKLFFRTLGVSRNMWFIWPLEPHFPRESSHPKHMDSPLEPHFPRRTTYFAKGELPFKTYGFPIRTTFSAANHIFRETTEHGQKASQTPPKVSKSHPNFFGGDVTYGHLTFCKKTGQIWYIVASGAPFLIYRRI